MKVKSLALGMILPLAASVALATAPVASAATPTQAAITHSAVSANGHGYGYGRYGGGSGWYNGWGWNEARYYPYDSFPYGGVEPFQGSWKRCSSKEGWGYSHHDLLWVAC